VNSIQIGNQFISKVAISETTNDLAFIGNNPNKLYFYTGNCEKIGEQQVNNQSGGEENDNDDNENENTIMKSLCFSNATEGLNVNVIACGLSNGRIRLFSTWDLSLLREFPIYYDTNTHVGSIISLAYTRDGGRRLYASDTYARVYILEAGNSSAAQSRAQQIQLLSTLNSNAVHVNSLPSNYAPNFTSFT
jgi:hypothetical protein